MTIQQDRPKWWRPRFSLKTLVIVVTLLCLYAACWGPTKDWGTKQLSGLHRESTFVTARAIAPLLIAADEEKAGHDSFADGSSRYWTLGHRRYYFWCFGFVAELPFGTDHSGNSF